MEDFTTPAVTNANQNLGSIDAPGLTKTEMPKSFNANVGKQNVELKKSIQPISTQTDSLKTPNVGQQGVEGLRGAKAPESSMTMPDTQSETTGFAAVLSKRAQTYMSEKTTSSSSQTPTGENRSPTEKSNSIKPMITNSPQSPQRPESQVPKMDLKVSKTPKSSAPGFKSPPSMQMPKFTLPNFKR